MEGCRGGGVIWRPRGEGGSKNFPSRHSMKIANQIYSLSLFWKTGAKFSYYVSVSFFFFFFLQKLEKTE